jgi:hypothetical protein
MTDICRVCGEQYSNCKMPLFHNLPTINSIELPARIRAIGNKTPDQYTSTDIAALNDYTT